MTVGDASLRKSEYQTVIQAAGFCRSLGATLIELSGEDHAPFLHNLCTADINGLQAGEGCELFFTDVRGKTIGYGWAFVSRRSILLSTVPDQASVLLPHLDRYLIREDVQIFDRSNAWQQWALCGPQAEIFCQEKLSLQLDPQNLSHRRTTFEGLDLHCCRTEFFGLPGFLLQIETSSCGPLATALASMAADCAVSVFQFLRIQAGSPLFGIDITPKNLPQEIDRDAQAISFTKGCYLGQETVARIDALGQVQQFLRRLKFPEAKELPPAGTLLEVDGQKAGHVTSASESPEDGCVVALGMIRCAHAGAGTQLSSATGKAEVL